jgi:hypothetical protein
MHNLFRYDLYIAKPSLDELIDLCLLDMGACAVCKMVRSFEGTGRDTGYVANGPILLWAPTTIFIK